MVKKKSVNSGFLIRYGPLEPVTPVRIRPGLLIFMKQLDFSIEKTNKNDAKEISNLQISLCKEMQRIDPKGAKLKNGFEKGVLDWYSKNMSNKRYMCLKAISNGNIIGFLDCEIKKEIPIFSRKYVGHIHDAYTLPKFRKEGICSALIAEAMKWFKKNNIRKITLETLSKNTAAINFYKRNNFEEYRKQFRVLR